MPATDLLDRFRCARLVRVSVLLTAIAAGALLAAAAVADDAPTGDAYLAAEAEWRAAREERLRSETGWLTIAGLHWLRPGENTVGGDPESGIPLPAERSPAHVGVLELVESEDGDVIRFTPADGVEVTLGDAEDTLPPSAPVRIASDRDGRADQLQVGGITFWVIHRGDQYAVRVRDPQYEIRTTFTGIDTYPVDPAWRVEGRLQPSAEPMSIIVPSMLGYVDTTFCHGAVSFEVAGNTASLFPISDGPEDSTLFFVFEDATSGGETYGAGRFLVATIEPGGRVMLDFNRAYNPPCAFNPNTTCPLPPDGNKLGFPVTAGEKAYDSPIDVH